MQGVPALSPQINQRPEHDVAIPASVHQPNGTGSVRRDGNRTTLQVAGTPLRDPRNFAFTGSRGSYDRVTRSSRTTHFSALRPHSRAARQRFAPTLIADRPTTATRKESPRASHQMSIPSLRRRLMALASPPVVAHANVSPSRAVCSIYVSASETPRPRYSWVVSSPLRDTRITRKRTRPASIARAIAR